MARLSRLDGAVLSLSTCPGPGGRFAHPPHRLSFALDSAPGQVYRSPEVGHQQLRAVSRLWVLPGSSCVPAQVPGLLNKPGISPHPIMETLPCPYTPTGLSFLLPGLGALPLVPCLHAEALTCSLSSNVLCAPESLPQCSVPLDPWLVFIYPQRSSRRVKKPASCPLPSNPCSQEREHVC